MSLEANFPIECIEEVLRHLTRKELLNCTLVCPDWNEFIGSTRSCMNKIRLELKNSTNAAQKLVQILKKRKWTHLSAKFGDSKTMNEFLQLVQSTVEDLKLTVAWKIGKNQPEVDSSTLQFP